MIVVYPDNKDGFHTDTIPEMCEPRPAAPAAPSEQDEQTEPEAEKQTAGRKRKDV